MFYNKVIKELRFQLTQMYDGRDQKLINNAINVYIEKRHKARWWFWSMLILSILVAFIFDWKKY